MSFDELMSSINGPWRNDACIGYAVIAMKRVGVNENTISDVVREMEVCFDEISVEEAAGG